MAFPEQREASLQRFNLNRDLLLAVPIMFVMVFFSIVLWLIKKEREMR